jgi:OmpA-OmpF porin, OOP family
MVMIFRPMLIPIVLLGASPALAQQAPGAGEPTVAGYLCTFAGKCDGIDAPVVTKDAPRTKGFRLARPVADTATATAAVVPDGRSKAADIRRVAPQTGRKGRPAANNYDYPRYAPASTATAATPGRPRADLMIGFELNSAQLTPDGVRAAQIFAKSLMMPELKAKRFLIEGHTDLRGGRDLNMTLSRQRAAAVANYLVSLGVTRDRLETRGFGPDVPLPGRSASDPNNRRVEAELLF